jgi:hypothetical protein
MPPRREVVPAGSHFIVFAPTTLPGNVMLKHKVGYGYVDLEFRGMGDRLAEIECLYRDNLLPGMRIEKAANSAVIRMRVDPMDITTEGAASDETRMRSGIEKAALLLDWFAKHGAMSKGSRL